MKGTRVIVGMSIFLLVGVCFFTTAYADWKPSMKYITVYDGVMGGTWHPIASLTSQIIQEAIPGLSAKPGPGGGVANCKTLQAGKGYMALGTSNTQAGAYQGLPPFGNPHTDLRHMVSLVAYPFVWLVRKDSNLTSIEQLADKRISPAKVGQSTYAVAQATLNAYGITFDSIKANGGIVHILGDRERVNMLQDKHVDAIACMWPLNHANFLTLQVTPGVRILSMDKTHTQKVTKASPGVAEIPIPKGTFQKSQTQDILTVGSVTTFICRADLDDELVYRITKAIIEGEKRYEDIIPASGIVLRNPLVGNLIPVHPGAMRCIKEMGLAK